MHVYRYVVASTRNLRRELTDERAEQKTRSIEMVPPNQHEQSRENRIE